jgi:hypothetical protein
VRLAVLRFSDRTRVPDHHYSIIQTTLRTLPLNSTKCIPYKGGVCIDENTEFNDSSTTHPVVVIVVNTKNRLRPSFSVVVGTTRVLVAGFNIRYIII